MKICNKRNELQYVINTSHLLLLEQDEKLQRDTKRQLVRLQ